MAVSMNWGSFLGGFRDPDRRGYGLLGRLRRGYSHGASNQSFLLFISRQYPRCSYFGLVGPDRGVLGVVEVGVALSSTNSGTSELTG